MPSAAETASRYSPWPRSCPSDRAGLTGVFDDLLQQLLALPPYPVYMLIGTLAAVENVFPPVPADTAVALGAFLAAAGGQISVWAVFGVTWVANLASATGVYVGARTAGRAFFRTRMGRRLIRPGAMTRIEHLYDRYGAWGIFFSRFIPAARAVVPPFAGLAGLDALRALVPMAVASAIWYGSVAWIASTVVKRIEDLRAVLVGLQNVGLLAAGVIVIVIVVVVIVVRRRRRPLESSPDPEA